MFKAGVRERLGATEGYIVEGGGEGKVATRSKVYR